MDNKDHVFLQVQGVEPDVKIARVIDEARKGNGAVAALPELYRVPVVLRYFSELSIDEIATLVGRPSTTVAVQLLRARALLRVALGVKS